MTVIAGLLKASKCCSPAAGLLAVLMLTGCGTQSAARGQDAAATENHTKAGDAAQEKPGSNRDKAVALTIKEFYDAFKENAVAGNLKYEGKWLKVSEGKLSVVAENKLEVWSKNAVCQLVCYYPKADRAAVAKLKVGQTVTLTGRLREESGTVSSGVVRAELGLCEFE